MKKYLEENMNKLIEYCDKEGLSVDKIKKSPRCYSRDFMLIQYVDKPSNGLGLKDEEPAKILLTIRRTPAGIEFEPAEDIKEYLS